MTIFHSMTWLPFPTPTILFLVPILFLATLIIFKRSNPLSSSPLNLPPRPPPLPIIGNLHQIGVLSHNSLWSLSKAYGPLMHLKLGSVPTLVISSAKLAREVMKHQDLNFCTKPSLVSQKRLSYNFLDIGFAPYGEYWREKRKVCMVELFSPKRIESFGFIREEEVARMIESISKSCSSFKPINLSDMLLRLTSNIIYRAAFGKSHKKGDENSDFYRVFEDAQALLVGMDRYAHRTASMVREELLRFRCIFDQVIDEHLDPKRPRRAPRLPRCLDSSPEGSQSYKGSHQGSPRGHSLASL